jgi:HlyD family secretion protein
MMKMRTWIAATALLGVGLTAGILIGTKGRATPPQATVQSTAAALTVSVVKPERKRVADTVRVVGQTRSRDEVRVVAELSGLRIARIEAEAGDYVRAGQTLAVLDGRSLDIESDELRSELERARGEYERARALVGPQLVSREFFKQKQSAYEVARAQYDNARLNVQRTRVVAPATGRIFHRSASIGDLTDGSAALFEIAKDGVVELELSVPETAVAKLRPGMRAQVKIAGRANEMQGEIRLILPNVDGLTRASGVRVRLDDASDLPVGVFAEASIDVAETEGWALPRSAIQRDSAGQYVWRVESTGKVRRQAVNPTIETSEIVVVSEPLGGTVIVAKAGALLRDNDLVLIAKSGIRATPPLR